MSNLLIVEDEMVISTQLEAVLSSFGYSVAGIAATGTEALALAKKHQPDLVLMDIVMPGELDGIDVAAQLTEICNCSILFITAHTDGDYLERAKALQPAGYLLKPFRAEQVEVAVELALFNRELEKQVNESEANFRALAENAKDGILVVSKDGSYVYVNQMAAEITGYSTKELLTMNLKKIVHPKESQKVFKRFRSRLKGRRALNQYETVLLHKDGTEVLVETTAAKTLWKGKPAAMAIIRDVSRRKQMEEELSDAKERLEQRVTERTRELDLKTRSLEEINTALKVMMKKREEDKKELEEKVLVNVHHIAAPYLKRLRQTELDAQQTALVDIIESNLKDIVSPFSQSLASQYFHLTPKEIHVANLIKQGKSTKEIGEVLSMSVKTVESHRKSIRRKLNLTHRGTNLRSYLMSLP